MMAADSLHVVVPLIVPSGMSPSGCRRVVARAVRAHSRRTSRCLRRSRPTCRRLASNALGLRPSWRQFARSPARWLLLQQRRRAAAARSASEGQRRRQDKSDTAPGRVESQSAHGERSTEELRRRAAWGARPAPMQACPRASRDRTRRSLRERGHDRPPRRRFPRAPSAPTNRGKGQGQTSFPRYSTGGQGQRRRKSAVRRPGTGVNGQRAGQRPGSRLGRGHTVARFADAKLTSCRGA